jgi:nicotinate-nucleotide pyrophosphorylase (carboxylating)
VSERRPIAPLAHEDIDAALRRALEEDLGDGDRTSEVAVSEDRRARGRLLAKERGLLCGLDVFRRVFELLDPRVEIRAQARDGEELRPGRELVEIRGRARALLAGERTALNFVQRMSGIATRTARFVERVGAGVSILDTRKTTPGLRVFEKYAVRCGGGVNHRFGLYDEAMLKDNHLDLAERGAVELLQELRSQHGPKLVIHCEARDDREALDAVRGGADVVMLDNMQVATMSALCPRLREAARAAGRAVEIEASGRITLENVAAVAASGVDRISVGSLTHSSPALDLSLVLEAAP